MHIRTKPPECSARRWPWPGPALRRPGGLAPLARERARLVNPRSTPCSSASRLTWPPGRRGSLAAEPRQRPEDHPTHERLWALLMRAQQAVGDTAAALRLRRRPRAATGRAGVEPGSSCGRPRRPSCARTSLQGVPGPARRGERRQVSVIAVSEPRSEGDPELAQAMRATLRAAVEDEVGASGRCRAETPGHGLVGRLRCCDRPRGRRPPGAAVWPSHRGDDRCTGRCRNRAGPGDPDLGHLGAVVDRAVARALGASPGEVVADAGASPDRPTPVVTSSRSSDVPLSWHS